MKKEKTNNTLEVSQLGLSIAKTLSALNFEKAFGLPKREAFVLQRRLSSVSMDRICDEIDLTKERGRQILNKAVHRLSMRANYLVFLLDEIQKEREVIEKYKEEIKEIRQGVREKETISNYILPIDDFYSLLSVRALNVLKHNDILFLDQLDGMRKGELIRYRNMGAKSLNEIEELLEKYGMKLIP